MTKPTDSIIHSRIRTKGSGDILLITLHNPASLNALNSNMISAISEQLVRHRDDDSIHAVVFTGAGEKAFCAGGDIRSVYYMLNQEKPDMKAINSAIEGGYALNYMVRHYPKPTIAIIDGIAMGGGLGLLSACKHKIVSPKALMAMPEISIGLFPDAGASYFLNQMMGDIGLFLGLTGMRFVAADAYHLKLANAITDRNDRPLSRWEDITLSPKMDAHLSKLSAATQTALDVLRGLSLDEKQNNLFDHPSHIINDALDQLHNPRLASTSWLVQNLDTINRLCRGDLLQVDKRLRHIAKNDKTDDLLFDAVLKTACQSYAHGSPTTAAITWKIYHSVSNYSIKDITCLEARVSQMCCQHGDFKEGVRALLIDKDKKPKWQYNLHNMPKEYLDIFIKGGCDIEFIQSLQD